MFRFAKKYIWSTMLFNLQDLIRKKIVG